MAELTTGNYLTSLMDTIVKLMSGGGVDQTQLQGNIYSSLAAPLQTQEAKDRQYMIDLMAKRGMGESGVEYANLNDITETYAPQYEQASRDAYSGAIDSQLKQMGLGLASSSVPLNYLASLYGNDTQASIAKKAANAASSSALGSGIGSIIGSVAPSLIDLIGNLFKSDTTTDTTTNSYFSDTTNYNDYFSDPYSSSSGYFYDTGSLGSSIDWSAFDLGF